MSRLLIDYVVDIGRGRTVRLDRGQGWEMLPLADLTPDERDAVDLFLLHAAARPVDRRAPDRPTHCRHPIEARVARGLNASQTCGRCGTAID